MKIITATLIIFLTSIGFGAFAGHGDVYFCETVELREFKNNGTSEKFKNQKFKFSWEPGIIKFSDGDHYFSGMIVNLTTDWPFSDEFVAGGEEKQTMLLRDGYLVFKMVSNEIFSKHLGISITAKCDKF